jgi:hypothetical protein
MRGTVGRFWLAWLAAAAPAAGGCRMFEQVGGGGLSFDLPDARFWIDTGDSRWWPCPPKGVPEVVCSGPAALVADCCQPSSAIAPAVDCQEYPLICDDDPSSSQPGRCALAFDYDDRVEVDLGRSVLALQDQRGWVVAQATVDQLEIRVPQDDAGAAPLPLRAVSLYVAPQGTASARAAGAVFLADIPWRSERSYVNLALEARLALSAFLMDFNTPFTFILSGHVVVQSGPVPTGVVTVDVTGRVHASF